MRQDACCFVKSPCLLNVLAFPFFVALTPLFLTPDSQLVCSFHPFDQAELFWDMSFFSNVSFLFFFFLGATVLNRSPIGDAHASLNILSFTVRLKLAVAVIIFRQQVVHQGPSPASPPQASRSFNAFE